jgi:hypothetical protein
MNNLILIDSDRSFYIPQQMTSKINEEFTLLFTLRESRGHRISGACPRLAGCQGFAVI